MNLNNKNHFIYAIHRSCELYNNLQVNRIIIRGFLGSFDHEKVTKMTI